MSRTRYVYPESISDAARWLDIVKPNWYENINFEELDMNNNDWCILGQSGVGFDEAMKMFSHVPEHYLRNEIFGYRGNVQKWKGEVDSRRKYALLKPSFSVDAVDAVKLTYHGTTITIEQKDLSRVIRELTRHLV